MCCQGRRAMLFWFRCGDHDTSGVHFFLGEGKELVTDPRVSDVVVAHFNPKNSSCLRAPRTCGCGWLGPVSSSADRRPRLSQVAIVLSKDSFVIFPCELRLSDTYLSTRRRACEPSVNNQRMTLPRVARRPLSHGEDNTNLIGWDCLFQTLSY